MNADLVISEWPEVEERIQAIRVEGILARAAGRDPRFADARATRAYLDELEANEGDQPLSLAQDLALAREAGMVQTEVFWKEHREVVWGGGDRPSPDGIPRGRTKRETRYCGLLNPMVFVISRVFPPPLYPSHGSIEVR